VEKCRIGNAEGGIWNEGVQVFVVSDWFLVQGKRDKEVCAGWLRQA